MMNISNVSRKYIFNEVDNIIDTYNKKDMLDIGSGNIKSNMMTLDKSGADFTGDIRTQFAPVYRDSRKKYRKLNSIKRNSFRFIRMQHVVEHIEWIYHKWMYEWVYRLLTGNGVILIETPNIEYIIDMYMKYRNDSSGFLLYKEHPDISGDDPNALDMWLNFKLFSGCSTNEFKDGCTNGDYHLSIYSPSLLLANLEDAGFNRVETNSEATISCLAYKE